MRRQNWNEGWKFGKNENQMSDVLIPHDAMLEQGRAEDAPSGRSEAFFLGGSYVYQKCFTAVEEWKNRIVYLEFEGVYPSAKVLLNGTLVEESNYGYNRFYVELSNLSFEQENEITVLVHDEDHPNSRWYGGAGIYRPVWIVTTPKEHIALDGVRVTTTSIRPANIKIETKIDQSKMAKSEDHQNLSVIHQIYEAGSPVPMAWTEEAAVQETACSITCVNLELPSAKLWSAETPNLYECRTILMRDGEKIDEQKISFGIRTIEWSNQGFFINGESVKLRGGCIHHDHGILGAKTYDQSEWRRIRRLKEFGFNAVRSSHNPLSRAALEACDALGMYVLEESFDTWTKPKSPYDHGNHFLDNYEADLRLMVDKDYNHPSVIMYSIGNEVTEPSTEEGVALGKKLIATLKKMDKTRPVTAGINLTLLMLAQMGIDLTTNDGQKKEQPGEGQQMDSTAFNKMIMEQGKRMTMAAATEGADKVSGPILDALDIAGYNYATSRYEMDRDIHPGRVIVGTETYPADLDENWQYVEKCPYIIGDFMWTAWDYLGEVGIGSWTYDESQAGFEKKYPWILADTGAFDILGNDNAEAGLAAVVWGARKTPYIAVQPVNHPGVTPIQAMWRGSNALPYWSYKNCDGKEAVVEVYTDAAEVELFVNEISVGRKQVEGKKATFVTNYVSGTVKAIAFDANGAKISESRLASATGHTMIRIRPETEVKVGDILYLDIDLVGDNGEIECNADETLKVSVDGAKLLGFGSANPCTEESYLAGEFKTYYGRSQAVILVEQENVQVCVNGETLETVSVQLS